jgi:hypothetical protein
MLEQDLNLMGINEWGVIQYAARYDLLEIVKCLLDVWPPLVNLKEKHDGATPLMIAAQSTLSL